MTGKMFQTTRRGRIWSMVIPLLFLGACLPANAATSQEIFDVTAGDRLAHTLCNNCHVVDAGPVNRDDPVPSFTWTANKPGASATSITVWLSISHQRMPNVILTDDEIRQLSAYIMSLRR